MLDGASSLSSRGTDAVNVDDDDDDPTTAGRAPPSTTASVPRYYSNRPATTTTAGSSSPPSSAPPTGPLPVPFPSSGSGMATPSRAPNGPGSALRQRGESSPVTSRHTAGPSTSTTASSSSHSHGSNSLGDDPLPSKPFVRRGSSTAAEGLGSATASSTSRRVEHPFVSTTSSDQWATSREHCDRAYSNGKGPATEARPARRQHYVEPFGNHDQNSAGGPIASTSAPSNTGAVASSSSSRSQYLNASSASSAAPNSSKSVLTIALQRAQSAVLLDSANNVPAAISAYSSSVRLLKEVMARVEDGARRDREKLNERGGDRYVVRPGETEEDAQKRIARIERKERAKMDEARRLKVIHDTYEDRIRMLQSIELEQADATPKPVVEESGSAPRAPTRTEQSATPYITAPPMVSRRSQNRSISSLETVSIPPATFATSNQASAPSDDAFSSQPLTSLDETDTTPKLASKPFRKPSPAINDSNGTTAGGSRRPSLSPERLRKHITTERPVQLGRSASSDNLAVQSHQRFPSNGSDDSDDRVPVTARETASGWPTQPENGTARERETTLTPASYGAQSRHSPTPGAIRTGVSPQPSQYAFQPHELRRTASDQAAPSASPDLSSWSNETRAALSSAAVASPLNEATKRTTGVRTSSLLAAGHLPFGEEAPRLIDARPHPARGPIMASGGTGIVVSNSASAKRRENVSPLVNDSTTTGTISQRRRSSQAPSPVTGSETTATSAVKASGAHLGTVRDEDSQRDAKNAAASRGRSDVGPSVSSPSLQSASSASTSFMNDFGPTTASEGGYSSASLPTRLRTHSQPGQRPSLSSFQNQPPVPSIVTVGDRSISSNGPPKMMRKSSVPSPTSPAGPGLGHPPSLVRTNSVSSQGSYSERDASHRGAPSPFWNYLDTFASSREVLNGASTGRRSIAAVGEYVPSPANASSLEPSSPTVPLAAGGSSSEVGAPGTTPVRRPFYLMRQILQTIETDGAYITPTLYIPHQVWSQAGVKLVAVETKVRMLDLLLTGLEAVDKLGKACWRSEGGRSTREAAARLTKELESFEGLTEGIQSTLSKKLGYASTGKKVGTNSFSAWSSKLSRSLDRVTNGRSLDHPATYVDSIARVLQQAQCLDVYLVTINDRSFPLSEMDERDRAQMALRLKRLSEFFGGMICRFILRDIGMLVDKYVKRAGVWFSENSN
ncbi:BZ3500_MvSof-1268-A1-R1_Chr5-2g07816 [Microbotryum saponariae]|uniref:BZ3500_MvSof-1268-A1-R1_Chr5-2g07816 protein n=1 Tax=Microbotryum saponariae TaxID=289078 RepID=A0A2X0MKW2_9BASI|nr:BZ3500_MvSof-1268-A1-R1_Chr5-2g07816 [Microbotryum saponariae]SDA05685.1 BZ3501_MvSof-1269-A2-R1_Chr5-2g07638 [Microbotryum saponariae]